MNKKPSKKGFKLLLVKYLALMMGVCYLANPLHHQIGVVFHEISHLFIMPISIMSHSSVQNHGEGMHDASEHIFSQEEHRHQIVDLLNSIFKAADDSDDPCDESLLTHIKFDKHITDKQYTFQRIDMSIHYSHPSLQPVKKISVGHAEVLEEPPQNPTA